MAAWINTIAQLRRGGVCLSFDVLISKSQICKRFESIQSFIFTSSTPSWRSLLYLNWQSNCFWIERQISVYYQTKAADLFSIGHRNFFQWNLRLIWFRMKKKKKKMGIQITSMSLHFCNLQKLWWELIYWHSLFTGLVASSFY